MPPKNARAAPAAGTAQRAARRATRSASQASSEAESQNVVAPVNGNPAGGPDAANAAILEELRRYREAYGGQLPNGEAAAVAGAIPIPPGADQNPPPPPPPPPMAPAAGQPQGPNYWEMMRHMRNMQMEFFSGKADAITADNWRRQLERNFVSARCPPEFRRDLAVHHLKDDALVWWEGVTERAHGIRLTWDDFLEAFNEKYFPPSAMDQMESKFQDIRQGSRNVREYGDEFNRLRRFAGHYLSDRELVRRFLKGMRIELRNSCSVRDYRDIHELIEKAAEQEIGLEEERRQHQASQNRGTKRTRDAVPPIDTAAVKGPCRRCGRNHQGDCRAGVCFNCGRPGHVARECQEERRARPGIRCHRCGQDGHMARDCRAPVVEDARGAQPQQQREPAGRPRAYVAEARGGPEPIAGTF